MIKNPLILALDLDEKPKILALAQALGHKVGALKVGPRLLFSYGPELIRELSSIAPIFVDHKFLDIPSTMISSVRKAFECGASFCTVHCWSGPKALSDLALLERELNTIRPFKILAVTVLTSYTKDSMPAGLQEIPIHDHVRMLALQAHKTGIRSFVCSPHEIQAIRSVSPEAFIVTPGIRLSPLQDDQNRVSTPVQAMEWGANAIVIGRPILEAHNPETLCDEVLSSIRD